MKLKKLFIAIVAVLIIAIPTVIFASESADPEYITVKQPVSNIYGDFSAAVRIDSADELFAVAAKENLPALAIFEVDTSLNVLDKSGNAFSTVYGVIEALNFNVIPVYYVDNEAEATAISAYLAENFVDAFVMSDSLDALSAAKKSCPLLGMVADYTQKTEITAKDYETIRSELYGSYATVLMLDGKLCTQDVVNTFKNRSLLLVWADISDNPTETEIFSAINSGAVAVVSDDSDAVIDMALSFPENSMTRIPYVCAHRGDTDDGVYFENTTESIINAYRKGAKWFEFDFHLTAPEADDPGDGSTRKLVLYHDGVTKVEDTTDGVQYDISETPWSVLYEKVLYKTSKGNQYRLNSLDEVLEYFSEEKKNNGGVLDIVITLEIKPGSELVIVDYVMEMIEEYDLFEQAMVSTFEKSYIDRIKEINPAFPTNFSVQQTCILDSTAEADMIKVRKLVGPTSSRYGMTIWYGGPLDLGSATVRTMNRRGFLQVYWGLGTTPENYLHYGIMGIETDYISNTDPLVFSVSPTGLSSDLKAPSGRTIEIGAVIDKRIELGVPTSDFEIKIIEGEELVKSIDGGNITFKEATGEVSFTVAYNYKAGKVNYILYSDPVTLNVTEDAVFESGVSMEGFSIRLKEYNGLRGLFTFDKAYSEKIENELGYTLVEFGAIAMPESAYTENGNKATIDHETLELATKGYKAPIWSEGKYVNRILEDKDGVISYCLAVVDFKTRINENLYFCAYSVYTAPNGETVISYADYAYPEYRLINLYQTTLDMYVCGAVNSKNSDDAAVWNTLLTGVVTLTEGTDYTASDAFGDTFTMKEFSACGKTEVSSIKLTVVNDPKNDSWVLIYRGSGSIPGTAWDVKHQLASQRGASYAITNPILTAASDAKIKTVVIDHGITGVGGTYAFAQLDLYTLVYPETFETMMASAFYHCPNIRTVYCAHGDGVMRDFEEGLADYSYMDSFAGTNLYINVSNIPSKLHLPANITAIDAKLLNGSYGRGNMKAIWCGNTAEPAEGTIDLTGAPIVSIGSLAFDDLSALHTLILPDSCNSINESAFTDSGSKYITKIMQKTYNASIAEFCNTNSITYTNLSGVVHTHSAQ